MPIRTEDAYRSATIQAQKFEQAIAAARRRKPSPGVHPRIHKAEIDALESELALLREQLDEYQRSRLNSRGDPRPSDATYQP